MPTEDNPNNLAFKPPPRDALHLLNAILERSTEKQVSDQQLLVILDALAGAADPALVARFPAVLAICARQGIALDSQGLLARYWETSPKRLMLEKLLFLSAELFRREGLPWPRNLDKIAESLKTKHAGLLSAEDLPLPGGSRVPIAEMRATLARFGGIPRDEARQPAADAASRREFSPQLRHNLELLFSEKQTDLLFKRLNGEPFTKTEREYFSRVVRKKLAAIVDPEIRELAGLALTRARRGAQTKAGFNPQKRPVL
jgi:hypothetical protein